MIAQKNASRNDTPRASQSPKSSADSLTPKWRPPRAPLPPHRLAKLANALGVSTPVPATYSGALFSRSLSESASPVDPYRRSPTPSTAASTSFTSGLSTTSKFLLQVIPPLSFPYDPEDELLPSPPTASGYHTQFRRGVLIPVYSSFQTQLSAIAKEYALPSTVGLILYLINNSSHPSGLLPKSNQTVEEPGPRLSDDVWRHIWGRIIQVEHRDDILSSQDTPGLLSLKTGLASRSTPHLVDAGPPHPLMSTPIPDIPPLADTTSPSTPSTASHSKSVADSSPDDPETPDTSAPSNTFDTRQRAQSLDLPGLNSPSLIPILAKVEFDIDRRKAVWYEPWLRTRKANHAKRAESRVGRKGSTNEEGSESQERQPPIQLIIGRKETASPMLIEKEEGLSNSGYQQLSDSNAMEDEDDSADEGDLQDDLANAQVNGKDPLADVFGTDSDTWADIHAGSIDRRSSDSSVVDLALSAADLSALPNDNPSSLARTEEEEVRELIERVSRPDSSATAVGALASSASRRSSSSTHTAKKHVPPPLVLVPKEQASDLVVPSEASPVPSTPGSVNLAYLNGDSSPEKSPGQEYADGDVAEEFDDEYTPIRSSSESEKRAGTIYDDLDLGLDPTEDFDENDPNDRRRSQFLLKAQLDEIERTMAQLSPRMLNTDIENDVFPRASLSPKTPKSIPVSPNTGSLNADYYPSSPSPRAPHDLEQDSSLNQPNLIRGPPRSSGANATTNINQAAWPAVPFSSICDSQSQASGSSTRIDGPPSPPRLALNGVTTSAPKSFVPAPTNVVSAETERRKRELEEEYPALAKSPSPVPEQSEQAADDSVIPLSPDPFGRYPSSASTEPATIDARLSNSSSHQWDSVTVGRGSTSLEPVAEDEGSPGALAFQGRSRSATTSRFSADSVTIIGEEAASVKPSMKTTLMTVRSIKKLWRKSNNKSTSSNTPALVVGRNLPQAPPMRPERPSQETMDLPDVEHPLPAPPPNFKGGFPPVPVNTPPPIHSSGLMVPPPDHQTSLNPPSFVGRNGNTSPIIAAQMLSGRGGSSMGKLRFDQESPYPVHVTNSPRYSPRAVSPPLLPPAQGSVPPSPVVPAPVLPQQLQSLPTPVPEKEKLTARKSILKAFQKSKTSSVPPPTPTEPRPSFDQLSQASTSTGRPRRPSFHSTKSSMTSVNDIPPSPRIPEQFLGGASAKNGTTLPPPDNARQSRLTTSSTDSAISQRQRLGRSGSPPPLSMASSRSSQETRPSFDVSQFEIVSPKTSTLTYPYHNLDHQ
ncbi:hypothetical protein AN958_06772 [Leucoagaricus sp. SymC.cos]|nr:hypothetical protein AN958_06772 [Leucoagaricus sp. SymC.cos]